MHHSPTFTPAFSLAGDFITFTKTGAKGRIIQNKDGYAVHLVPNSHVLTPEKAKSLEKRMRDWYYFSQVKNKP